MSFEDSNSFLFGLNHFTSPGANPSSHSNDPNHNGNIDRDGGSTSLLDGLSAFGAPGSSAPGTDHQTDEEKDKEGKDKEDDQGDADRRAGKRSRKKKNDDTPNDTPNAGRNLNNGKRNGKDRLRDENQLSAPQSPIEPIQQRDAAGLHSLNYFGQQPNKGNEPRSHNDVRSPSAFQGNLPFGASTPFVNGHNGAQPNTSGPLDLTSLLALQQLLSQNPLAMASLGSFNGLNPQLGALGNQLGGFGGNLSGPILQQLQSLQQQQQQQQSNGRAHQQNGVTSAPPPSPFPGGQFSGFNFANGNGQGVNGHHAPFGNVSHGVTPNGFNGVNMNNSISHSAASSNSENSPEGPRSSMDEGKGGDRIRMTAEERADILSKRAAERDIIPPLKLIDTGNPEADAEANRNAIEEDKRRRNTAASARFRMKKKQREAALESHTKELQDQLADLREELEKLRNENQWLKDLIQVRSGSDEEKKLDGKGGSSVEALQAAQQLQALQHAVSTQQAAQAQLQRSNSTNNSIINGSPNSAKERTRDTGIRPRGVGTQTNFAEEVSAAGQKRDREL
ncbi:hypothetical protein L7F22_042225 [Adiantum nelumboides]|nr:hypothetical protein [Adiantum nelumboides]